MANQPHHDDDQAKTPAEADKAPPPAPDTPPRQMAIPNLSLDEPDEEMLEVVEVIEDNAVPVAEAAPVSDAVVFADDNLLEEVESVPAAAAVKPDSDVVLAEPGEAAPIEVTPVSDVLEVEVFAEEADAVEEVAEVHEEEPLLLEPAEAIEVAPAPVDAEPDLSALFAESVADAAPVEPSVADVAPVAAAPEAEPDLSALFAEAPAAPIAAEADASAWPGGVVSAVDVPSEETVAEEIAQAPPAAAAEPEEFAFVDEIVETAPAEPAPAADFFALQEPMVQSSAAHVEHDVATPASIEEASVAPLLDEVEEIAEAAPGSAIVAAEEAIDEPVEVASGSAVVVAEAPVGEIAEAAPGSAVVAAEEAIEEPAEFSFGSAVVVAEAPVEEVAEAAPGSAVFGVEEAIDEPVEAASGSAVVVAEVPVEEIAAAAPGSAVIAAEEAVEEVAEAAPGSAVLFAEDEAEVIAEAAPASDVVAAEEVEEAAPLSDVFAAEEAEEVVEAASAVAAEEVLAEDVFEEAAPASAEIAEEAVEAVEEISSATRKAEGVLDDDEAVAVASAVEEAEALEVPESGVVFDDDVTAAAPKPRASKTRDFEQTLAFEPPASGVKSADDDDLLVTEEEVLGTSEASAVDLGEMPRKSSSVAGIDPVAEALESGTDLGGEGGKATAASVEFDELLDKMGDSDESEFPTAKKKKAADEDGSTEMDAAVVEEAFGLAEAPSAAKKKGKKGKNDKKIKTSAKATGDDIDLDEIFSAPDAGSDAEIAEAEAAEEVEAAEALDGEEIAAAEEAEEAEPVEALDDEAVADAEEAEDVEEAAEAVEDAEATDAAEAFDEEMEAAEATDDDELADFDDAKPTKATAKKGKTAHKRDEDEEDEDEDASARKKKSKKEKIAPPPPQRGRALPLLGGMFVATLLLVGGVGAGWYFAPDQIIDLAEQSPTRSAKTIVPPPAPKVVEKTRLAKAHEALDQRKFQEVLVELKDAKDPEEFSTRGEAKWLAYFKQQTDKKAPLDKDDAAVKDALDDLTKAKNDLMIAQINASLKEKELADQIATTMVEKKKVEQQLTDAKTEKEKADKVVDSVAEVLVAGKLIDDKAKFDVATLDKVVKSLNDDRATLDKVNKILDDEKFKGKGEVGLLEILKLKKQADDNFAAVNKVLEDEKIKDEGAKGVLEIVDARNKTAKDRDDLLSTVKDAFKEFIDGKIVKEDADARKQLIEGAKLARQKAESPLSIPLGQLGMSLGGIGSGTSKLVEDTFSTARTITELKWYETREPFIQKPHEKLDTHIKILQDRANNDPKSLAAMVREADWVMSKESKADAEARAKAQFVKGLTLRNEQKFAEATKTFKETIDTIQPMMKVGAWKGLVTDSYRELTDPTFYYLPRMDKFQAEGNLPAALAEANVALKAMPEDGRLFAARGLIRFERVRGNKGKIADDIQKDIRADAEAAAKDEKLAAESAYINGLLDEELGKIDSAEKLYRQAIKLHEDRKGAAEDAGKYRVALGRLLLRDRDPAAAPAAPPAEDEKKKKDDKGASLETPAENIIVLHPWSLLAVSAIIAQQPIEEIEDKETLARLKDVMAEADKLKNSKSKKLQGQGYCLMGAALSKLGKRTEGLKEFARGLELLYPGIETKEINDLIAEHPAFQQPDVSNVPNPVMAERHFGEGMHLYWSKKYEEAEAQFRQSVKYYDKDARYQYFLGLAQLHQRTKVKRDAAIYSFEVGARLEAKAVLTNPYATREVNQSLERIQGELRQLLNYYRYRPSTEPEAKKEVE